MMGDAYSHANNNKHHYIGLIFQMDFMERVLPGTRQKGEFVLSFHLPL